jgi:MOB kinase activator 1
VYVLLYPVSHSVDGVDVNEWIAVKMLDLFSELTVLCNAISDICTPSICPIMRAGKYYEYAWADPSSTDYVAPTVVSAPRYMELLMKWVDKNLNQLNESQMNAGSFNINIKIFCRRLFRVYAHIFCEHFEQTKTIHAHLHYSLFHFVIFMNEYGLMVSETEAEPIRRTLNSFLINNLSFTLYLNI